MCRDPQLAACVKGIATFAAPRSGDAAFASHYDSAFGACSLRYVNASDMVPMLPPRVRSSMVLFWEHLAVTAHKDV